MDWLLSPPSSLLVALLAVLLALVGLLLLLRAIARVGPGNPILSRATFACPVSRQRVTVEFLLPPGSERPADVLSCSLFSKPYHIRCEKRCLTLADTSWTPRPMMARGAMLGHGDRPAGDGAGREPGAGTAQAADPRRAA